MRKKRRKDVLTLAVVSQVLVIVSCILALLIYGDGLSIMIWALMAASVVLLIYLSRRIRGMLLAVSLPLHACTLQTSDVIHDVERRDSAGVHIVESHRPAWDDADRWAVDSVPKLDLAETGTGINHEFSRVRGMTLLSNETLVVVDGGSQELRLFGSDGQWLNTNGGRGEGPGEFRNVQAVIRTEDDVILALDYDGRVTMFDRDLALLRTFQLPKSASRIYDLGNDLILVELAYQSTTYHQEGRALVREPSALWRFDLFGARMDSVGEMAGYEEYMFTIEDGPSGTAPPLFGKSSEAAARDGRVFVGDADVMEIREIATAGALMRIMRIADYSLDLTDDAIAAERQARLGEDPHPIRVAVEGQLPSPKTRPAYDEMIAGPTGAVWLRRFRGTSEAALPETWEVLSADGRWLGSVEAPRDVAILDVGVDVVAGVRWDELHIEHPVILALRRD